MSVLGEALARSNLKTDGERLPKGRHRVKDVSILISNVRAVEAEFEKQLSKAEADLNKQLMINQEQAERIRVQDLELVQLRLHRQLKDMEGLSEAQKRELLQLARPGVSDEFSNPMPAARKAGRLTTTAS